jgi:hypothetical protein
MSARAAWTGCVLAIVSCCFMARNAHGATQSFAPYFVPGTEIRDAVAIRYTMRVHQNQSTLFDGNKIIFTASALYNPRSTVVPAPFLAFSANLYASRILYADNQLFPTVFDPVDLNTRCLKWPEGPRLPDLDHPGPTTGLWVPGYAAARNSDPLMFPRQQSGIDGALGINMIQMIAQMDVTAKDITLEFSKGESFFTAGGDPSWGWRRHSSWSPIPFWNPIPSDPIYAGSFTCRSDLPAGSYQIWRGEITIDEATYVFEYAYPFDFAQYLAPEFLQNIVTEFLSPAGFFQALFWDMAVRRESSTTWIPLTAWKVGQNELLDVRNVGSGGRVNTYDGHAVLEISNDGTDTYLQVNDIFQLPPPANDPE